MSGSAQDPSLSFGSAAAAYERGRPSYPPEAIDWLLPAGARDVLDLGAGTGKLTTRLVERGLDVVAVDPIPEMLEVLRASLPRTLALLGTAEEIPLEDNSVDAVLVAQAWHWVDPARAIPRWPGCCGPAAGWDWCGTPATSGSAGYASWAGSSGATATRCATKSRCPNRSRVWRAITWSGPIT
ncbi:methyltransferase domain protein [Mycobacterium ulcerans str. Harvey]|uniref:Methyltransferase domain protein n=1 Tax=Mycobacterium ulcerans str. Harvey TaxID=1299332 RepID=A0ABP3AIQ7_MYCUL|nr:methyltransferase domain protein [Mycobacterium ulcerans str. Harvey]